MKFQIIVLLVIVMLGFSNQVSAAEVSLTFDDFDISDSTLLSVKERNRNILNVLDLHHFKATLFVPGKNVDSTHGKGLL